MPAEVKIVISTSASGGGAQQVVKDLNEVKGASDNAGGGLGMLGTAAATALGGVVASAAGQAASAITGFVGQSIGAAGEFQSGLNMFAAAAGGSLDQAGLSVQDFSDLFMSLGQKLPVSTAEVEQAAIALVKGGLDPAVIAAGGLESSLNFAAGAGMNLEAAAELGVKMLGTFTSVTDDAATKTAFLSNAQDLLVKAANASTLNVDQLGDAMLAAGGQARAVGLDYQDFVTSMGLISPSFGSAAEAGTSFKNFLTRLQPSTKSAREMMLALGLSTEETGSRFFDTSGKFIGVQQSAQLLQDALAGLTDAERVQALQTIFGNDAMGAASALAQGGAEAYQAFAEQMAAANGVSAQAAAVNQGFDFAMTNLSGTLEVIQLKIGTALLPVLELLVTTANNVLNAVMGDATAFASLAPPLQAAVMWVQQFGAWLVSLQPLAEQVAGVLMNNWQPALAVVGGLIAAVVVPALASMVVAFAPVIAVVGAAIAIAAAIQAAWSSNFMNIQGVTASAMAAIQSVIQSVMTVVLTFWQQNGAQIMAFAQTAWTQISQIIGALVAGISLIITTVFGAIASFINEHGATIQAILTFAWNSIQNIIQLALNTIQGITNTVLGLLTGNWKQASDGIQQIVGGLWAFIQAQFNNILTLVQGIGPQMLSAAANIGKAIIDGIVNGISSGVGAIISAAKDAAQSALDAAMSALGIKSPSRVFAAQVGLPIAQGMAQGIDAGIPAVAAATAGAAGAAVQAGRTSVSNSTRTVNYTANFNGIGGARTSDAIARSLAGV